MGHERQPQEGLPLIGCLRSAETVVATRKKSWRLDGHKLDRQRDWLEVSEKHSISSAQLVLQWVVPDAVGLEPVKDSELCCFRVATMREAPTGRVVSRAARRAEAAVVLPTNRDIDALRDECTAAAACSG
jgi:hypothetical protein